MIELGVELPAGTDRSTVPALIERFCAEAGLTKGLTGTLKTHPGSTHWHFGKAGTRGTLEITWIEASRRLWFSMQSGRSADWVEPTMARLKAELERS